MMKKALIVIGILMVILLIAWGVYRLFFVESPLALQEHDTSYVQQDRKPVQEAPFHKKLSTLMKRPVLSAILLEGDIIRFWQKDTATIYEISMQGKNLQKIVDLPLLDVESVLWSKDGNRVIITIADHSIYTYTISTKEFIKLRSGIDFVQWADAEDKIIYKYFDNATGVRSLNIAQYNGLKYKKIVDVPYKHVSFMQAPDSLRMLYWPQADGFLETALKATSILSPGSPEYLHGNLYGASFLYAPDGKHILVSSTMERGGKMVTLGIINIQGGEYTNLRIPTIVQKVVWNNDGTSLYYAQPNEIPEGSVMPNDYHAKNFITRDSFWRINIENGKRDRIIDFGTLNEEGKMDATNLMLTSNEDALLYINRDNNLLYRLNI